MDSEVHEYSATLVGAPIAEKQPASDACEDMPTDSVSTNGIGNLTASGVVINFIDEEHEQMGDIQEAASFSSYTETQPTESQDGVEIGEETEIIEKNDNDIIDEEYDEEEQGAEEQEQEGEEEEEEQEVEEAEADDELYTEEGVEGVEGGILQQKKCAQVPKKRKFAPTDNSVKTTSTADGEEEGEEEEDVEEEDEQEALAEDEDDEGEFIEEDNAPEVVLPDVAQHDGEEDEEGDEGEEELPTSSRRAAAKKENTVDEETCRVCTTKDNLISLFKHVEQQTIADMLMTICPHVSIACKDFMPQYVCQRCLDNVTIAVQLKSQCESTERELRKKLSRHKNKVRRPAGYVVIDAPVESDPEEEEEEPADDVEFKVSDVELSASADESYTEEDSDFDDKKKRAGKQRTSRKSISKIRKEPIRIIKRVPNSSDEERERLNNSKKKKANNGSSTYVNGFPCDECDQVFTRKVSLVLHKKTHTESPPIICNLCGKHFKMQGSYRTHMSRHKNEKNHSCGLCSFIFSTKGELRKHQVDDHNIDEHKTITYKCEKCARIFSTQARLHRHMEGLCHGIDYGQRVKKNDYENYSSGRDLFKAVAPLTTTYWSDSFSD